MKEDKENISSLNELISLRQQLEATNQARVLEETREQLGLSKYSLSSLTHTPMSSVFRWHRGEGWPPLRYLEALKRVVELSEENIV